MSFFIGVIVGIVGYWIYKNIASAEAISKAVEKEVKDHID